MNRVAAKTERGSQPIKRRLIMTRRKTYQRGNVQEKPEKSKNWTLRYRELDHVTGEWTTRRKILGKFKTKTDALKASTPIMAQVNERNNMEPQKLYLKITFKEFVESYWKPYTVMEKHQVSTLDQRTSMLDTHLLPYFGKKLMREIQPSDISKFLLQKTNEAPGKKGEENYSNNTMRAFYGVLRVIFDLAEQNDVIDKSPIRSKLHKPEKLKVEKPTLNSSQIRKVLSLLSDEQERLFVLLLAVTGIRVGECLALRWMDFNAQGCELSINHTLYRGKLKEPKTKGSKAKLKLAPQIAALLLSHQEKSSFQEIDDFIFCRVDGNPLDGLPIRKHLYDALDQMGIQRVKGKYGPHIFRHSAGTLLYEKSRDLKLVQGTLRHSDISTTSDIYVHLGDVVLNEGSEILAAEILANCDLFVTQKSEMVS
jgi:integrase